MPAHYRFGEFKLLPGERLLFRRGVEQPLTGRAFAVLVAFVERSGQLLAKEELLKRVWAGLVVEENNLAVQVGVLRKLLGAEAITTIPGFGYRFALEVFDMGADSPGEASARGCGNLPQRQPSFIGRVAELTEASALLQAHPLLTICGGPGFGKTRLALELALRQRDQHADGVWWVDLTMLREGEAPAAAIARTLGVPLADTVDPLSALASRLGRLAMLIVLDNAEHRAGEVSILAGQLVSDTAYLRILVTSHVPLHAPGERLFRLAPLPLDDAVRLLAERAGTEPWSGDAGAHAAAICSALDGNALAIELAAARIDALGLEGLALRLHQRLTLLAPGDGVPSRRNALAAAMDWSHELLGERERVVLRRLAAFPGSFSLEGAALMLGDETLPPARVVDAVLSLVDRSLVSVERGAYRRFRLLETTRLFALERLEAAGETDTARARLCTGMRWLFEDAYEEFWRMPTPQWCARYGPELTALWSALGWAVDHDLGAAAALFGASSPLWRQMDGATLASSHARVLAGRVGDSIDAETRARFWLGCAHCHSMTHPGLARDAAEQAATLYRELGDTRGEYLSLVEYAFNWRVDCAEARNTLARAKAIESAGWPAAVIERGRTSEAVLHMTAGRHEDARRCYLDALEICQRGGFARGVERARLNLADLARAAGHVDEAVRLGESLREQMRDNESSETLATVLANLLGALIERGRHEAAREVALDLWRRVSRLTLDECAWLSLDALALLHLHDGRTLVAARLAGAADREFDAHGQPQRQPNEAKDRAALAAGLASRLSKSEVERLHAQGQRMSASEALAVAFDLDQPEVAG
jgi:predicted ATPase/DNA-binding winged helix-turn-helix (wHTH) protein